ncbi:MAG: hypothetical protein MJA30_08965 [Cytophagales bacterium]|nr:hypothetical protein [Cytophagales bacterium]
MEKISLELTIDEANTILAALGQQPYIKVAELVQKIQGQGASQLNAQGAGDLNGNLQEKELRHIATAKNGK